MSMSGSLISYENPPRIKHSSRMAKKRCCSKAHVNCLWSVWYGLCLTGFQAYIIGQCAKRFVGYVSLPWPMYPPPRLELHAYLILLGSAILVLPFFLIAAVFKTGNLANDGFKLGRHLSTCTADPPSALLGSTERQGVFRSLWQHGGPTAAFLHLIAAFCLLLPKLLIEARLIQAGLLSKDAIWRTDLDFMVIHRDRLVVLSFMSSPPTFSNSSFLPTAQPLLSSSEDPGKSLDALRSPQFAEDSVSGTISPEFLNYALALVVYAVRYPSVFWNTNKWFGTLFSFQLLGNAIQALISYAGMSVLYKVQVVGAFEALPLLKKAHSIGSPFLLDNYVTLGLFVLSSLLVLSTSLVLYLYGYGRFNAFLNTEKERKVIVLKESRSTGWGYFTHCAALCVLLALAVCHAPLLHDYTVVYRGSLDGAILACVISAVLHLFLWVLIWLILTVKQHWIFQLRITVGRAAVRSARSVKLVTDVDLVSSTKHIDDANAPLLVVGNGRTYTIADISPKKTIMNVIQKAAIDRKVKLSQNGCAGDDTEIYWLRPKPRTPQSPSDSDRVNWFGRKISSSQKPKVTFDDSVRKGGLRSREKTGDPALDCEDDGDYATLRVGPGSMKMQLDDNISEENKLLEHALQDESVTFARSSDLQPDYEDPSPLLTPDGNELPLPPPPPELGPATIVTVHNASSENKTVNVTPRCLRRADSGMPQDELTPRSGSVSSGSQSGSGGSPPGAQNSESSSGVHSNASSRRATSVDDLTVQEPRQTWKSCSLQRNVPPPGAPGSAQIYAYATARPAEELPAVANTVPAVILENPAESTVVIRRKASRPRTTDLTRAPELKDEPFGRSTNMRMTSFTDEGSSATLPHFPTQAPPPAVVYPCNTLPCPPNAPVIPVQPVFPRPHTTIPIHHNGVRLFPAPYAKRLQHAGIPRLPRHNRDSANFSMASSGESDSHS
ncbi:UNVERIFIED_CONTAM: hypothetical protein PYX00_007252 [Menopon gallinae]|uniref:Protein tincar n=1 Tax=Menopon gallinae TaxID=328185 RepID=A0AAW2HIZ8_9NEOP